MLLTHLGGAHESHWFMPGQGGKEGGRGGVAVERWVLFMCSGGAPESHRLTPAAGGAAPALYSCQ